MKGVLTVLVLTAALLVAASLDSGVALAVVDDAPQGQPQGIEVPHGVPMVMGDMSGEGNEGDPDDIGGGFRSSGSGIVHDVPDPPPGGYDLMDHLVTVFARYWFLYVR